MNILYILDINPLSNRWFTNVFSHSECYIFNDSLMNVCSFHFSFNLYSCVLIVFIVISSMSQVIFLQYLICRLRSENFTSFIVLSSSASSICFFLYLLCCSYYVQVSFKSLPICTWCVLICYLLIPSPLSFLSLFILTDFSPGYGSHISASLLIWSSFRYCTLWFYIVDHLDFFFFCLLLKRIEVVWESN